MFFLPVKRISSFFFTFIFLLFINTISAQCFEIESILVDACGSPEGENEMVRFKIGSTALNTSDISVNWPNNPWLGICQNATTAQVIDSLNNTILGCGLLIEPTAGVLPATANVLLITSTAIDVAANSFTNLGDTLYVIFQCVGNTSGHFANYNTIPGLRTLSITFTTPVGCTDTVTYNRTLLVNQNGNLGGPTALKNGALANFDPAGNITYVNQGCQAPFSPTSITVDSLSPLTICPGDSVNVFSTILGTIQSIFWIGNLGSFSSLNDTTTYFSSINDTLPFNIIVGGISSCNDTIYDTLTVNIIPPINVFITGNDTLDLCHGQNLILTANGAASYLWSTGSTLNSITVNTGGTFYVTGNNTCFSDSDSVFVNLITPINVSIIEPDTVFICNGDSITLHAIGGSNYTWSTSANNVDSIVANSSGSYYVISTNSCFNDTAFVQVNVVPQINLTILEGDSMILCVGNTITLHATGGGSYNWNNGTTTDSLIANSTGQYWVNSSNGVCPSISDTINVINDFSPSAFIISDSNLCSGSLITLNANGLGNFNWSTGDFGITTIISSAQQVILTATNSCNVSVTDTINITEEDCSIKTDIIIPNVFTPDKDNFNDIFRIEGVNIITIEGSIFNRWGTLLYEWNNSDNGWDGTYEDKLVPEGSYFYILSVTFINNKTELFKGTLLLLN